MFIESIEIASTAVGSIELWDRLAPTFAKFFRLIRAGKLRIVVFGAGGTGKSTLGKLLSGDSDPLSLLSTYQESIGVEALPLSANRFGHVIIAPGQERRQENTWPDLLREVSTGTCQMIIHVVAYGYHSFEEFKYSEHRLFREGMTSDDFIAEYARIQRDRELNVLKELIPHLSIRNSNNTIFITLVTKQDLWWNSRLSVKNFYTTGSYEEQIQLLRNRIGAANLRHECLSVSLVMENFLSGSGEFLAPVTQGYDERLKLANLRYFLSTIETLLGVSLDANDGQ
jgi:hypothetical protein